MKAYKMLINCKTWDQKDNWLPLSPTRGDDYIFKTKQDVYEAYNSLYYKNTFIAFGEFTKLQQVEVPDNFNNFCNYGQ